MELAWSAQRTRKTAELPLLDVQAIAKTVASKAAGRTLFYELSLHVGRGEIVGVVGGKFSDTSTLIDLIAGRIALTSGRIIFNGQDLTRFSQEQRQRRGIVRALPIITLAPDLTAFENVVLGGAICPRPFFPREGGPSLHEEARDIMEFVGLGDAVSQKAGCLRPAQKQLLAIAAALAARPSLLLIDEIGLGDHLGLADFSALLMRLRRRGIAALIAGVPGCPTMDVCDRVATMRKAASPRIAGRVSSCTDLRRSPSI